MRANICWKRTKQRLTLIRQIHFISDPKGREPLKGNDFNIVKDLGNFLRL